MVSLGGSEPSGGGQERGRAEGAARPQAGLADAVAELDYPASKTPSTHFSED